MQFRHVGGKHVGEVESGRQSSATRILRIVALDNYNECSHAVDHLLPLPFDCRSLRNMEALLQGQQSQIGFHLVYRRYR